MTHLYDATAFEVLKIERTFHYPQRERARYTLRAQDGSTDDAGNAVVVVTLSAFWESIRVTLPSAGLIAAGDTLATLTVQPDRQWKHPIRAHVERMRRETGGKDADDAPGVAWVQWWPDNGDYARAYDADMRERVLEKVQHALAALGRDVDVSADVSVDVWRLTTYVAVLLAQEAVGRPDEPLQLPSDVQDAEALDIADYLANVVRTEL